MSENEPVVRADEVDGTVYCPGCGEDAIGESELRVSGTRGGAPPAKAAGGGASLWAFVAVEHTECGTEFEIGGPAATTSEDA